ncbi:MAG: hypothetical protein M3N13_08455 [Candidatus Eremiobacteraeota bacterium]|nr:hypothetical protein [Candidatus Eremiobacteraeota bacterium]
MNCKFGLRRKQRWAQLSEKFADLAGFEIKYGEGPEDLEARLISSGRIIYLIEQLKRLYHGILQSANPVAHDPEFGRIEMLAKIEQADVELEAQFSELKLIIQHLERE